MKSASPRRPFRSSAAQHSGCDLFSTGHAFPLPPILGQPGDIWPAFSRLFVIAKIEHRRASHDLARMAVEGSEDPIPEEIGDAEVSALVVEVVSEVESLDPL